MSLALYMDHHVPAAITRGLRRRGVDVLTAKEDGAADWDDSGLLDRAGGLRRILFTRDSDLLARIFHTPHELPTGWSAGLQPALGAGGPQSRHQVGAPPEVCEISGRVEAASRWRRAETFASVAYAHQLEVSIGRCVADLEIIAQAGLPEESIEQVIYLPL